MLWILLLAGATAVTVISACASALVIAGFTIIDVLLPITVEAAEVDVAAGELDLCVLVVATLPFDFVLLLELPPHAPTASAAAAITPSAGSLCKLTVMKRVSS